MAQTQIKRYFTVRKRASNDENIPSKRRKISDSDLDDTPPSTSGDCKIKCKEKAVSSPSKESPRLEKFKSIEFTSPKKSNRRLKYDELLVPDTASCGSSLSDNESTKKVPAYKRLSALALPQVPQTDLPLPYEYRMLEEKFRCVDVVSGMFVKRQEICTFDKLKQAVQEMTRKNFEVKHLAQMKTVYPEAFIYRQETHVPGTMDRSKYNSYQLTVETNIGETDNSLIKRKKIFHNKLLDIAVKHHEDFLSSLNPPITIPRDKLYRWHPAFLLDSIPDIVEGELPRPPIKESYTTAKDVLEVTQNKLSARVQIALATVAKETDSKLESRFSRPPVSPLKGVSATIIEKVRQKEAVRAKLEMTRNPENEKKIKMMSRLPEMCRILRSLFVTEGKAAIPLEDVFKKVSDSHTSSLTSDQVSEHIHCLLDVIPEWIMKVSVRKVEYLKIKNKGINLKTINQKLEKKTNELSVL